MGNIDFSMARFKHLNWKFRIRSFLDGSELLTYEQAVSHKDCDLGKWIYSRGLEKYGHLAEMKSLEKVHIDLHQSIRDIITQKEQGNLEKAEGIYQEMLGHSDTIIDYLTKMEKIVKASKNL